MLLDIITSKRSALSRRQLVIKAVQECDTFYSLWLQIYISNSATGVMKLLVYNIFLPVGLLKLGTTQEQSLCFLLQIECLRWMFWEKREVCRITSSLFLSTPGGELRSFIPGILCLYAHMKAETKVDKQASKVHSHLLLVDSHPDCVFWGQRWTTSLPCQHLCVRVDLYLLMYASHRAGGEVWWVIFDKYPQKWFNIWDWILGKVN